MAEELMLKVEDVYKKYRLGTIGGGTLTADLQSWWAKVRHKEDPNSKIGAKTYGKNEVFYALNGISFEVRKGEALGIIGGNGAGKSTTLKLISQVTAPTKGKIYLNGRITSMLEVGTGFHPELTGRENIYLNGAILGMTKAEIDSKIEEIIDFSECRQFIDTPVKRYSSGMYVKLAFSVAAHLDSEIMIMDEVLAVGDMAFQKKCIDKMKSIATDEGRTILYVSHNMNTIRQLCDRVVVLNRGRAEFDGDVEEGISIYLGIKKRHYTKIVEFNENQRQDFLQNNNKITLKKFELLNRDDYNFGINDRFCFRLWWDAHQNMKNVSLRVKIISSSGIPVAGYYLDSFIDVSTGSYCRDFEVDLSGLMYGTYSVTFVFSYTLIEGRTELVEAIVNGITLKIVKEDLDMEWHSQYWGYVKLDNIRMLEKGD